MNETEDPAAALLRELEEKETETNEAQDGDLESIAVAAGGGIILGQVMDLLSFSRKQRKNRKGGAGEGKEVPEIEVLPPDMDGFFQSPVGQAGVRALAVTSVGCDDGVFRALVERGLVRVNSIDEEAEATVPQERLPLELQNFDGVTPLLAAIIEKDEAGSFMPPAPQGR
jgi:hypothetical protein